MKLLKRYDNKRGVKLMNKIGFGYDGKNGFHFINNKYIFCIHFVKVHFFYLKPIK